MMAWKVNRGAWQAFLDVYLMVGATRDKETHHRKDFDGTVGQRAGVPVSQEEEIWGV